MDLLLLLLPFAFVASFTPGPNNILVMSQGINFGFRSTVPYLIGAGAACFLIIGGALLAGAEVQKIIPIVLPTLKYVGCAYMLYLAWEIFTAMPAEEGQSSGTASFTNGFLLQFLNPKFYLYTLVLVGALAPRIQNPVEAGLYSLFFAVLAMAAMFSWALSGAMLQNILRKHFRMANIVMSLSLVYCSITLL